MDKLSLSITSYNRFDLTINSFKNVINDNRIDDILILDDGSTDGSFENLKEYFKDNKKIRVLSQVITKKSQLNKKDAVELSLNDWVILLDSDNVITSSYLDAIPSILDDNCIYTASWVKPQFDFRKYQNIVFNRDTIKDYIKIETFPSLLSACMNDGNYLCNKNVYLKNFKYNPEILGADVINHLYNHFKNDGVLTVVENLHYDHLVHDGSMFLANVDKNMKDAKTIETQFLEL